MQALLNVTLFSLTVMAGSKLWDMNSRRTTWKPARPYLFRRSSISARIASSFSVRDTIFGQPAGAPGFCMFLCRGGICMPGCAGLPQGAF